jgi:hypothetical protein
MHPRAERLANSNTIGHLFQSNRPGNLDYLKITNPRAWKWL